MKQDVKELFFKEKPVDLIIYLLRQNSLGEKPSAKDTGRAIDTEYSHVTRIVSRMEEHGLVERMNKRGRKKPLQLTSEGRKIAKSLNELLASDNL